MKKKIFSALLTASLLTASLSLSVFADATYKAYNGNVYVSGNAAAKTVTVMLVPKSAPEEPSQADIKYMTEVSTDKDGNYSITFPYDPSIDIENYEVRESTGTQTSVTSLGASPDASELLDLDISLMKNATYAGLATQVTNYYNVDVTALGICVFAAFYDSNSKLVGIERYNLQNADINERISVPAGAAKMKCFVWEESNLRPVKDATAKNIVSNDSFVINCWGDSLTYGSGGSGTTYPGYLASIVGSAATVTNYGIGGEDTRTIAGRQGGVPFVLSTDIQIPADTTPVNIDLLEGRPFIQTGFEGINPCYIDGIEGTIARPFEGSPLQFTRTTAGSAKSVSKGTEIMTAASEASGSGKINIIFTGANDVGALNRDAQSTTRKVIDFQKAMADKIEVDGGKYLIVGVADGEVAAYSNQFKYLEKQQEAAFGNFYFNLREALTDPAVYEEESISLSAADRANMASGNIPTGIICSDGVHFNANGYKVVARAIYNKLVSLGWVIGE